MADFEEKKKPAADPSEARDTDVTAAAEEAKREDASGAQRGAAEETLSAEGDEDYRFVSETVKRRPPDVGACVRKLLRAALYGIIFGGAAACVLRLAFPVSAKKTTAPVTISSASRAESGTSSPDSGASEGSDTGAESGASGSTTPEEASSEAAGEKDAAASDPDARDTENAGTSDSEVAEAEQQLARYASFGEQIEEVAEEVSPSVVKVSFFDGGADWFSEEDSTVNVSGLVIADNSQSLLILAVNPDAADAEEIRVTLEDGSIVDGSVQAKDPETGFAIVAVAHENLTDAQLEETPVCTLGESYSLKKGEALIAIGSPMGYSDSVNYGEITSLSETVSVADGEYPLISTNMIGSADGSGFLLDFDGSVVGLIYSAGAESGTPVITGIPISPVKALIEALSNDRAICRMGIHGAAVTPDLSEETGLPVGVYVTGVDQDSPALDAGIQTADIITGIDALKITSPDQIRSLMLRQAPEDKVKVTVERQGAEGYVPFTFEVTLGKVG